MDTIYALSSGALPAGVAVLRLSGPLAGSALAGMAGELPPPGQLTLRTLRDVDDGLIIDKGLIVWSPAPRSFTGEDVGELQVHGSRAVVQLVFDTLQKLGLRQARPGEFIRRAFENGKLDLSEVEGVADLIAADTEAQRRQAVRHSTGMLREACEGWRDKLISLRAQVEAQLDFTDEGDVEAELGPQFYAELNELHGALDEALQGFAAGEKVREGFQVAIVGRPNVGKSSLLNALARREVAIVTDEPGTTRDVLEVELDLNGYAVRVFDTAGIREAASAVEQEGIRRAHEAVRTANLVLLLEAPDAEAAPLLFDDQPRVPTLRIFGKADLSTETRTGLSISSKTGEGVTELLQVLASAAAEGAGSSALLTRARHKEAVIEALTSVRQVHGAPLEVTAHLLRTASEAIGRISGRIDVEDVLDRLFGEFCIGK